MIQQSHQNRQNEDKRQILDAYRTLGSFVSGKMVMSQTLPLSFAVPTRNSYKIYSDVLAIKVVSPPLSGEVKSVLSYNEYSYVRAGDKVTKMKYHHIVKQWQIAQQSTTTCSTLMKFDNIILLGEGNRVYVFDEKEDMLLQGDLDFMQMKQQFLGMIHPVTYINKLVLYNQSSLTLINPLSKKTLYDYPNLREYLRVNTLQIVVAQSSKLVNIIALSLSNGQILILNLKKDEIVFKFKLKQHAICIAFCDQQAMMATSDEKGNVVLWDLQNKRILYKFDQFISGPIDSLIFTPGQPIITCGSSSQNCIRQLRVNLQDNRILTLFRQRVGITSPIQRIQLLSNNQLMISSQSQSMFTSLYSHTNNYKLRRVLDSSSSYHIISKHFSVQLFKNQTMQKEFNIHESAYLGKISLSQKYYIVATKTRLIKLGVSGVEMRVSGVKEIVLFQQHFVYVITNSAILVLDFTTLQLIKEILIAECSNSVVNHFGNLLALYSKQTSTIQIYDMQKIQLAREFTLKSNQIVYSLAFTSDNKYLLSTHPNLLIIWSVVHNNLFKQYTIQNNIVSMQFTEDNQFLLSVFQNQREINIWNNYIGKLSSNRETQTLKFNVTINHCEEDFRAVLKRKETQSKVKNQQHDIEQTLTNIGYDVLASIVDSNDFIPEYRLECTQKWLPLIYYDEIKQRNTIENAKQVSLPFFLDFRNIDDERKKIQAEIKEDLVNKKREKQEKIDQHLKDDSHQIRLSQQSTPEDYIKCLLTLQTLSIAEIDYQLRTFLLNPINKIYLLKMFSYIYLNNNISIKLCEQFINIVFHRTLYLIGNEIFDQDLKQCLQLLLKGYRNRMEGQKIKVDKCVAITEKLM